MLFLISGFLILGTTALSCLFFANRSYLFKNRKKNSVVCGLLFHSVTNIQSSDQSHITPEKFERFLQELHGFGYCAVTASESIELLRKQHAHHTHHTILSAETEPPILPIVPFISMIFDDGFENFFYHAFPILQNFNMKVSLFPVVGFIDQYCSWDIYHLQKHLSKLQIRYIADAGHEIGSHTLSHPDLRYLHDDQLEHELSESKKILEDIIGRAVTAISFPFGGWNQRVWSRAQACGYTVGVAYRNHSAIRSNSIVPVTGIYKFDTITDMIEKIQCRHPFSLVHTCDILMPHFAQGTPAWKFRREYDVTNLWKKGHLSASHRDH
ncbi:MAG: polysaccharide deacetylase family protein [Chitinivibrionales bacterium]|nr:polysaccharide deacetylase family protein [Chitinivibrionales bacterium]